MSADRNLSHLYGPFRELVVKIIAEWNRWATIHAHGYTIDLEEGFRSAAYQHSLWEQGRAKPGNIVTERDGYNHPSDHQSSLAADLVPKKDGTTWTWSAPTGGFEYLQHLAHVYGLTSGADWTLKDRPHIQWNESDHATYAAAKQWQKDIALVK